MKTSIVYVYNSFKDPLFQATLWLYLKEEVKNRRFNFLLITYEQKEFEISREEKNQIKEELKEFNITWYPLKWHSGRFKLIKKLFDFISSIFLIAKLYVRKKPSSIISLGTVAGSFAYIVSRLFRLKNYIYQYERHSEFLADFGIWSRRSISFQILNYFERLSGRNSELLATGTTHMIKRLEQEGVKGDLYLLPSCVNDFHFQFSAESRDRIRDLLKIGSKRVVIYLGKFGGIYFSLDEVSDFFYQWKCLDKKTFFIVLTPEDSEAVENQLKNSGLLPESFFIGHVPHREVPAYLSAADMGIVAVPSFPSQKFRSPIKVGEYLCCGLPYVVGREISNDDDVALKSDVGIVLNSYSMEELEKNYSKVESFFDEERISLRKRCRDVGLTYRGFSRLKKKGEEIFDKLASL
ncbi:Glycosyltransferase involved in cell wall bisynthesis [Ekhidna lutea]|uniref:Glycosyltransferase involved in cell wall bisynthesis n=1 Tax=Ekhidna lutea TaxID=447679 RepID=A0A239J865_EKHLU|nr:glycosyltransferase [Ekhidna lutea]SNT02030.1 Glycosyltransferase involved in cell wall bisynthesis [Ekhidna lutea]